jgi:DNA-binding response OmpR family regulator
LIPSECQFLCGNQLLSLTGKSFDLLVARMENGGRLVEREEFAKAQLTLPLS